MGACEMADRMKCKEWTRMTNPKSVAIFSSFIHIIYYLLRHSVISIRESFGNSHP